MQNERQVDRNAISALVISSLHDMLSQRDQPPRNRLNESMRLIGGQGALDSLGLVTLIVDVEQRLAEQYGVSLTLADERAMSQRNSPFQTVQFLTDYICLLVEEQRAR